MIVCPGESLLVYLKVHTHAPLIRRLPEGRAGGRAESHPACIDRRQLCRKNSPLAGIDAPTPAREKGLPSQGALYCFKGRTEGFQRASGKPFGAPAGAYFRPLAGLDAPTPAREKGLQPYGALYCFEWRSEGVQGASGKPPACINKRQLCRKKFPLVGLDAPTPAREQGL